MTDRLYYLDPYLRAFDATIERVEARGGLVAITLDRTAFYPSSGGQPFDTGLIGASRVVDVVDEEDGSIVHLVEHAMDAGAPSLRTGGPVHGEIDWPRRFDHMQQHTGQHVLSAAFDRLFDVRTVSFHLGAAVSTIDLAREMSAAEIAAAETEANRIVWEDRPVGIRFATAGEAAAMPLRKEPARGGTLRLIDVEGFDLSACGGTHVARTGGIGIIAVASWERFKGGQRLSFLCGGRALGGYRALRDSVAGAVRLLSVLPAELPQTIERQQAESKAQQRLLGALQADLARYRADELAGTAEEVSVAPEAAATAGSTARLVARAVDADAPGLRALASAVVSRPGYIVVLVSLSGPPVVTAIARSADVNLSAQNLLSALQATFGGRGGGKGDFAQGGGMNGSPEAILAAARQALRAHQ
jgi:alanyl-tRNA synthetase